MGRGRPKRPAHLKETKGKNRERNYTKAEVEAQRKAEDEIKGNSEKVTDVPDYLSDLGKEYYSFIVNEMEVSGVLSNLDIPIVVQMAETLSIIRTCDEDIKENTLFVYVEDRSGAKVKRKNPAVDIRDKALSQFKGLATQLGMSPASRSSLASLNIEQKKQDEDPLLKVLNKRNG